MNTMNRTFLVLVLIMFFGLSSALQADCIKTFVFIRHAEKNVPYAYGEINCQGENRALALPKVLQAKYGKPAAIYAANPAITYADKCDNSSGCCYYNRPIATINPTAIFFSMPLNTKYGIGTLGEPDIARLKPVKCNGVVPAILMMPLPSPTMGPKPCGAGEGSGDTDLAKELLTKQEYCGKTVFISWEHDNIPLVVYSMYKILGLNPINQIPLWPYGPCLYNYCKADECDPDYNFDTLYVVQVSQSTTKPKITITLGQEGLNGQSAICPR